MNTEATKGQIQQAIQQLYEDEGLTSALTDEPATILLSWGEEQLKSLADFDYEQPDLVRTAYQLRRVMRAINRLVERQADQEHPPHRGRWRGSLPAPERAGAATGLSQPEPAPQPLQSAGHRGAGLPAPGGSEPAPHYRHTGS